MQSPSPDNTDPFVAFVPSKVNGLAGVTEIRIYRDRIAIRVGDDWQVFRYMDFAPGREIDTRKIPIGEWHYDAVKYKESHFIFYTEPRIAIYLPDDGPREFPSGHFWRIQELLRNGPFRVYDEKTRRNLKVSRPWVVVTLLIVVVIFGVMWLLGLTGELPDPTGSRARLFWTRGRPGRPIVPIFFTLPAIFVPMLVCFRHGRTVVSFAIVAVVSLAATIVNGWLMLQVFSWITRDSSPTGAALFSAVIGVAFGAMCGATARRDSLEPIPPDQRRPRR